MNLFWRDVWKRVAEGMRQRGTSTNRLTSITCPSWTSASVD
jgi:hypothetical protein